MSTSKLQPVSSIEDVDDSMARKELEDLMQQTNVLGFMLWGSKATGFGLKTSDWDFLIYITEDYYQTIKPEDIGVYKYDKSIKPPRLVIDFTYFSDSVFEDQLTSTMDIDHSAYVEGIVLYDPTTKLEVWRQKLAEFPENHFVERVKIKWIDVAVTFGAAKLDHQRNLPFNRQLNLHRTIVGSVHFWFTLQKTWTPPLKWFSQQVKHWGMLDETYDLFCNALEQPTIDTVGALTKHLRKLGDNSGFDLSTLHADYMETITPIGRPKLIRHGYL